MNRFLILLLVFVSGYVGSFAQTVYGDVNGDGYVTTADVTEIYNLILGNAPSMTQYEVNGVKFFMVNVNGGTFTMGATSEQGSDAQSYEKPAHQVTLSSFSIGQTEVTQELWVAVMGSNPSYFYGNGNPDYGSYHSVSYTMNLKRPVECVNWDDCQEFINRLNQITGLNFRLPTEAEWEYAARGGNHSQGYKYAGGNSIADVAWYYENSFPSNSPDYGTHPVATKAPNELGIYDMSGNVFEWVNDWSDFYTAEAQTNPTGPATGTYRIYRGGGWGSAPLYCRVAYRSGNPNNRSNFLGFRLTL